MKLRILSLMSAVVMLLTLVVGCAGSGQPSTGGNQTPATDTPQLVVAMNPIFVYDDGETIIPYNDVKNAMKADFQAATLNTMTETTPYNWMYNTAEGWKKRASYVLENWTAGSGTRVKSLYAYAYSNDCSTSLSTYSAKSTELATYGSDTVADNGLLLSVSGSEEEALTYTIQKDGMLNLVGGTYAAIRSVGGVESDFLAEDGVARSASVRILINDVQIFSGTLCNSTAAADGVAVTSLQHDQLSDFSVKAGSTLIIAVKLDAAANSDLDQSAPPYNEEDNWITVDKEVQVPVTDEDLINGNVTQEKPLTIFDGYDSRFVIVRNNSGADKNMMQSVINFRTNMEFILDTEVILRSESHDEMVYEIVVGVVPNRPESAKIYKELINYRANNANDYIIRRVGTKVYIVASNVSAQEKAFEYFLNTFCTKADGAIPAGYNYMFRNKMETISIAGTSVGNYVIRTEKYPTTMVQLSAEELQNFLREKCGYMVPIEPMTDDGKHYAHEIQVGPMNGSVKVHRAYDTRFTVATTETVGQFRVDDNGFMHNKPDGYYKIAQSGKHLVMNGGSSYAVSAAVIALIGTLKKSNTIAKGAVAEGTYVPGEFTLHEGYGMAWQEDFSYSGTDAEIDKEVREYYSISHDTTNGPTPVGEKASGETIWDEQRRPGIYGENWWIWHDSTGNGYLLEITKKESYGYDAGRLIGGGKWAFRYGIWETRIVVGTRNGACSAVWASSNAPDMPTVRNEHDVYENFGRDVISPCYHTWAPDNLGGHKQEMTGHPGWTTPADGEHFWDTFHSVACKWTAEKVTYMLDGKETASVDLTDKVSGQSSTTIKFANGVGTGTYSRNYNPFDWMDEAYTASTGKTVEDFFEVQTIDYSYIFQTSNEGKNALSKSYIKYDRTHPSSPYYTGYLAESNDFYSVQLPH